MEQLSKTNTGHKPSVWCQLGTALDVPLHGKEVSVIQGTIQFDVLTPLDRKTGFDGRTGRTT